MPDAIGRGAWDTVLRDASVDLDVRMYMLLALVCGDLPELDGFGGAGIIERPDNANEEDGEGSSI